MILATASGQLVSDIYIPIPLYGEKNVSVGYLEDLKITIGAYTSICIISEDKRIKDIRPLYFFFFQPSRF